MKSASTITPFTVENFKVLLIKICALTVDQWKTDVWLCFFSSYCCHSFQRFKQRKVWQALLWSSSLHLKLWCMHRAIVTYLVGRERSGTQENRDKLWYNHDANTAAAVVEQWRNQACSPSHYCLKTKLVSQLRM